MKIIVILLILTILLTACNFYKSDNELKKDVNTMDVEEIPGNKVIDTSQKTVFKDYSLSSCEDLVLEIVSGRYGMVLPQGKVLDIRVFKNRDAEYDYYEYSNNVVRKEVKLSESQLNDLLKMLDSKEMISSESEYVADNSCLDAVFEKKITFCPSSIGQRKDILVKECRPLGSNEGEKIPSQILNMIEYIDKINKSNTLTN